MPVDQLGLLPPPPPRLTPRQKLALDALRETPGGMTSNEFGRLLHAQTGHACARTQCDERGYWKRDGNQMGAALLRKRLVIHKGRTRWQTVAGQTQAPPTGHSGQVPY